MSTTNHHGAYRVADLLDHVEDVRYEISSAFRKAYENVEPLDRSLEGVARRVNVLLELASLYVEVLEGLESECDDLADELDTDDDDFRRCSTTGCGEIFSADDLDDAGRCPICRDHTGRDLPAAEPFYTVRELPVDDLLLDGGN